MADRIGIIHGGKLVAVGDARRTPSAKRQFRPA
jgi:ABC-type multidrug transport system ATPase subunit